jgi:transposase
MQPATPPLEVTPEELEALLETVREALGEAGYQKLKAAIRTLSYVTELLETREATLASLRRLLCHTRSERTEAVLEQAGLPRSPTPREPSTEVGSKKPGHGRKGAKAYPGAQRIEVPHATLYRGDRCPGCQRGKVYPLSEPGLLVRLRGQAPIAATVYELEKLRCNLCGEVFTAEAPAGVGQEKYDPTTASMIALLRYGSGFPWNRLADLEESLGVPLPVATQCEIVAEAAATLQPAMEELIRQAAQGAVLHNDDTSMPVLALRRNAGQVDTDDAASDAAERTGVFTSGIVSTAQKQTIALFFTGRQHAGENLADVLRQRAAELAPPLQRCDALSRNLPKLPEKLEVIVGHCLAHARRRFVEVIENFPQPCQHVLEQLGTVYGNDATARKQAMTPEERLRYHQQHSAPVLEDLRGWLNPQFAEKKVEPNSGLGMAMRYLLKHWERLTLFLRQPGAPLDNNIAERALKKAILHRKNSLFYKTANGARVGDLFMSLIHTCELCGANPFDYLTQLQRHAGDLVRNPRQWMPWNYQVTLESCGARLDSG